MAGSEVHKATLKYVGMKPGYNEASVQLSITLRGRKLNDPKELARRVEVAVRAMKKGTP